MRYEIPVAVTFAVGLLMILGSFVDVPYLNSAASEAQNWGIIVSAFALGVGAINLVFVHGRNIRAGQNTVYSMVLIAGILVMFLVGVAAGIDSSAFSFLYDSLMAPMGAAMFAMLAFYVASAAFRAFVARNFDAAVLLVTSVICILYQTGLGELIHPMFGKVFFWINEVPNLAGQRGIMICSAIGAISVSLRVLLGLERTYLGGD